MAWTAPAGANAPRMLLVTGKRGAVVREDAELAAAVAERVRVVRLAAKQRELCEKRALEKEGWEFIDP